MAQTYAQLRDSGVGRVVWWLEISGIPYLYSSSSLLTPGKFSDGYTNGLTFLNLLQEPGSIVGKSIDPLSANSRDGGMSIQLVDEALYGGSITARLDGHFTWLFGYERSSILRTYLTADVPLHAGGAGHNWAVADSSAFPASGKLYRGLETVSYASKADATHFTTVTRAVNRSEESAHRGFVFGSQTVYPEVTDHPIEWAGRIVTLFQSYMGPDNSLAGGAAGARAAAKRFRGILREVVTEGKKVTISCDSIDKLLDRKLVRSAPRARLTTRVNVKNAHIWAGDPGDAADMTGAVMTVFQWDAAGNSESWNVGVTSGFYTPEGLVNAINLVLNPLPVGQWNARSFYGQLTLVLGADGLLVTFTADAGTPCRTQVLFDQALREEAGSTQEYWSAMGFDSLAGPDGVILNDGFGTSEYSVVVPRSTVVFWDFGRGEITKVLQLAQGPDDSPASEFTTAWGQDIVVLESSVGMFYARVVDVSIANNTIELTHANDLGLFVMPNEDLIASTADHPVFVRRVYLQNTGPNALKKSAMQLMLSTGLANFNDPTYDLLPEGVGAAIPNRTLTAGIANSEGFVDVEAWERFWTESEIYVQEPIFDVIIEPMSLREWLTRRVAFFNGHIIVDNGAISVRKGLGAARHESRELKFKQESGEGRRDSTHKGYARGLHYFWEYDTLTQTFKKEAYFSFSHPRAKAEDKWLERQDYGVRATLDQIRQLASEALSELSTPGPIITVQANRLLTDIEPGKGLLFSDEGADEASQGFRAHRGLPNRYGTRGHSQTPTLVLGVRGKPGLGMQLTLLEGAGKRGGYSPTAWIISFAADTPAVGQCRLTCTAQRFSPTSDGADVTRFQVGEKVMLIRMSAPTGASRGSGGHTILAINAGANTIDLQNNPAGVTSGQTLILVHQGFGATQPASAKVWAGIGDSSGDIEDVVTELCYKW